MDLKGAIKTYRVVIGTFSIQLVLMALFHFMLLAVIQQWLSSHGEQQPAFFWLLFFICAIPLLSLGLLSSTLLAIAGGYFLGWESMLYYFPSYLISSYLGYRLIGLIDKGKTIALLHQSERLKKALRFLEVYPFSTVFFLRFSPVISFGQLTALCAFLRLHPLTYLAASALGMIPRTALAIWCGLYIRQQHFTLSEHQFPAYYSYLIWGLFIISLLGILYLFKQTFSQPKEYISTKSTDL